MQKITRTKIKPIWLILSGIATIGIVYGIYYLLSKDSQFPSFTIQKNSKNSFCKHSGFPLRVGSCGEDVIVLQKYLNSKIKPPRVLLTVDGKFGNSTKLALNQIEKLSSVSQTAFNQYKIHFNPFL